MNNNLLGGAFLVVASLACFSPTGVTDHSQTRESSQLNLIQPDPTLAEIVVGKVVVTYLVQIGTWNTETQQFDYIKKEQTISGSCFPIEWIAPNGDEGSNTKKIGRLRIMTVSHLFGGWRSNTRGSSFSSWGSQSWGHWRPRRFARIRRRTWCFWRCLRRLESTL